jgi:hypothetical protein
MSVHSNIEDITNQDQNHLALHERSDSTCTPTTSSNTSRVTIYIVASHRNTNLAHQYCKQVLNQHRLAVRDNSHL